MRGEVDDSGERNDRQALGRQLGVAAKAVRSYLEQRLAAAGSSFAVWTVLFALTAKGPPLTRHLARMESEGLIERHRTSTDRRAAVVRLTEAGEAAYARLCGIVTTGGDAVLKGFSSREIEEFTGYLTRLIRNVEAAAPSRRHAPGPR
jgi:MarR family transcriptional regulator, transcriptional regulator for hemolysin